MLLARIGKGCLVNNIRIPEDEFMRFNTQPRENDVNYDVLYQGQTRLPGFVRPWP